MSKQVKITIPGELPDLNQIIEAAKNGYGYKQPYNTMKQTYTDLVAWHTRSQTKETFEKIDLEIAFICKDRRKDKDNIATGMKFILDGLVRAGLIKNDGWKQIGSFKLDFKVDKDNPRVEVNITESN